LKEKETKKDISVQLINWYKKKGRKLPWRDDSRNGYEILIAEVLLQRTTAVSVNKIYEKFLKRFPNFETIFLSNEKELLKIISNLGFHFRTKVLKRIAQQLKQRNYEIPKEKEELLKLYGIGDYMASAIRVFMFNINDPILDSNMRRISERFWGCENDEEMKAQLFELAEELPKVTYCALLDLCWFICRAKPKCSICPINRHCLFFKKSKKKN